MSIDGAVHTPLCSVYTFTCPSSPPDPRSLAAAVRVLISINFLAPRCRCSCLSGSGGACPFFMCVRFHRVRIKCPYQVSACAVFERPYPH
ncbi:hypothetical protein E2C01_025230 [Portunus trituberculatus]|uniref:Uncharacterized protein n=1 Tax=Portunus trituberculatus TaxID=210409 RepID=A0A5B7EF74_PORTR|nr:hypothetical protein [Portunus trituberculatus]